MKPAKTPYHHGDLYQTLLTIALAIINDRGLEALNMRQLAEKAGVSRTAPYHHFKNKNALLCAIAKQGFEQQDQILQQALGAGNHEREPLQRFEQFMLNYVNFARDNPAQYSLMYGGVIWKSGAVTVGLERVANNSFKLWLTEIERFRQQKLLSESVPVLRQAQAAWAMLHGLCQLLMDGIYIDVAQVDEIARSAVRMLVVEQA